MLIRKILLPLILLSLYSFAHKVAGVDMSLKKLENNKIEIKAFFKKSKKILSGNEVKLISMFDNRVLKEGKLKSNGLILDIPTESYWVYVLVRDNDIVQDGIAPTEGFTKTIKKDKIAFLYSTLIAILFILLSIVITYYKNKKFKKSLT